MFNGSWWQLLEIIQLHFNFAPSALNINNMGVDFKSGDEFLSVVARGNLGNQRSTRKGLIHMFKMQFTPRSKRL